MLALTSCLFNPDNAQADSKETGEKEKTNIGPIQVDNVFGSFNIRNDNGPIFVVATRILPFASLYTDSNSTDTYSQPSI